MLGKKNKKEQKTKKSKKYLLMNKDTNKTIEMS